MSQMVNSGKGLGANSDIEMGLELKAGAFDGLTSIHKFGAAEVGTTYVPVTNGNLYRTPQPAAATKLRIKAGDVVDTAAGAGAREITLVGLDETGAEVTETLATAGTSASALTSATFIRLYKAWVSASGTYATATAGSHDSDIVIEKGAGSEDWATITATDFPHSQSEIAAYSVPLGYTAYIPGVIISVDAAKAADVIAFHREGILDAAAPYSAMRVWLQLKAVSGEEVIEPHVPFGPFPALTDIGFMAKVPSSTGEIDIDFEIILVKD